MATLNDLVTEHPGGWADILQALQAHAGESLNVSKLPVIKPKQVDAGDIAYKLANLENSCSGLLANEAQAELAKAGLPLPGTKHWLEPAEKWFRKTE